MHRIALFLRLWNWFSFRRLRAHGWRTFAVLVGIAAGAAVFTSVRLSIDASLESFRGSVDSITGKADLVLSNPGGRIPERIIAGLNRHPAVEAASPLLTTYVRTAPGSTREGTAINEVPFLLIGFDPLLDRAVRTWQSESRASTSDSSPWLRLVDEPDTVLLGQALARRLGVGAGDCLTVTHLQTVKSLKVLGVLDSQGVALVEGGQIAMADIATFQELTGLHGQVDRIDLRLRPGATPGQIEQIRTSLPDGILMDRPSELRESGRLMIRAYQANLSVLSFVSLFVGMFLVYSLVALHATSRRQELAVLLSLGASPRMIFGLFLTEGAFFGVVGWLLAVPVSAFLVRHLVGIVSSTISHLFVRIEVDRLVLDPSEVALSFASTLLISLLAALQPAREAMRVPPREALMARDAGVAPTTAAARLAAGGCLLIFAAWPMSTIPGRSGVPLFGYLSTFLLFCGFSLLSPWLLAQIGSRLPPLLRRIAGETAYLGGRYVRDAGPRVAISVGALVTAIALFTALTIMVHSFRETVSIWVHQSISGDLFLRARMAEINRYRDPLPPEILPVLHNLSTPVDLLPYRRVFLHYEGRLYQFEAIDFAIFRKYARFILLKGKMEEMAADLEAGRGVLVSEVFANQTGLDQGDRFHARVLGANFDLPILGIFRDYRTQGGVVHYALSSFAERTGDSSWSGARIHLAAPHAKDDPDAVLRLKEEILRRAGPMGDAVEMTAGADLRQQVLRIFDETFAVTTVLLFIALCVAALGITTTLTVLVLERTWQIHTLLAGGAGPAQVRSMIFWEAVLMVISGEVAGLGCGFLLSCLLIFVINRQSFGWTFLYSVDWGSLAASLPLILTTALLASLPACRMVLRRSPAGVLRER